MRIQGRPHGAAFSGGEIDSAPVCIAFGGTARKKTTLFVPCTDGIRAVDVGSGSIVVRWRQNCRDMDFGAIISATPGCNLLLSAELTILGVSDDYLRATPNYSPYSPNDSLETRGATQQFLRYALDEVAPADAGPVYTPLLAALTVAMIAVPALICLRDTSAPPVERREEV